MAEQKLPDILSRLRAVKGSVAERTLTEALSKGESLIAPLVAAQKTTLPKIREDVRRLESDVIDAFSFFWDRAEKVEGIVKQLEAENKVLLKCAMIQLTSDDPSMSDRSARIYIKSLIDKEKK